MATLLQKIKTDPKTKFKNNAKESSLQKMDKLIEYYQAYAKQS
jgi:hypothetical protein